MTAKEYVESFEEENGFWDKDKLCEAYIIALGVNDIVGRGMELSSVKNINAEDYFQNEDTFAGNLAKIIQRIKEM